MFDQWLKIYPEESADESSPYFGESYYMFTFSKKTWDGYEITVDFELPGLKDQAGWKGYLSINEVGTHSHVIADAETVERTEKTVDIWPRVNSETKQSLIMMFLD